MSFLETPRITSPPRRLFDRGRTVNSQTTQTTPTHQTHTTPHSHKLSTLDKFIQTTLSGDKAIYRNITAFGDTKNKKRQHVVRIGSHNENCINTK